MCSLWLKAYAPTADFFRSVIAPCHAVGADHQAARRWCATLTRGLDYPHRQNNKHATASRRGCGRCFLQAGNRKENETTGKFITVKGQGEITHTLPRADRRCRAFRGRSSRPRGIRAGRNRATDCRIPSCAPDRAWRGYRLNIKGVDQTRFSFGSHLFGDGNVFAVT